MPACKLEFIEQRIRDVANSTPGATAFAGLGGK
jgi:hypothetical protein